MINAILMREQCYFQILSNVIVVEKCSSFFYKQKNFIFGCSEATLTLPSHIPITLIDGYGLPNQRKNNCLNDLKLEMRIFMFKELYMYSVVNDNPDTFSLFSLKRYIFFLVCLFL